MSFTKVLDGQTANGNSSSYDWNKGEGQIVVSGTFDTSTVKLQMSPDGGTTWVSNPDTLNYDLISLFFIDANTGWMVGGDGTILNTMDGGITWENQVSNTNETLEDVIFISNDTGWVVGQNGTILKTTNGGTNWEFQLSGTN